jgi:Ca2+-binding EF-hand superfamily protein
MRSDEMSAVLIQLVPVRESDLDQMMTANKKRIFSSILAADAAAKTAEKDKLAAAAQATETKKVLEKFDKNQDGKLDFDELATASGQDKATIKLLAALFDKDADGALNPEELSAALAKLRN